VIRALAILLALAATAHADVLEDARQLESSLQYDKALALVEAAIASGHAIDLAKLHFEAGKLAAGLDRAVDAEQHFAVALELEPTLALPEGSSPKLTAPYYAARSRVVPLHISHVTTGLDVAVAIDADPLHLVSAVRVDTAIERAAPFHFTLPRAGDFELTALDDHDNTLFTDRVSVQIATAPPVQLAPSTPWYASWKTWAAVGVFAAGTGALCAWREQTAQDDWNTLNASASPHDYSQLRAIEDRGRDWALATNIGFGVAAAAVIAGSISFVHERRLTIAATPTSLAVAGRF